MKINRNVTHIITLLTLFSPFFVSPLCATQAADYEIMNTETVPFIPKDIAAIPLATFFTNAQQQVATTHPDFFSYAFSAFIQNTYNATGYADLLSRDSRHISEFLCLSNTYSLSSEQVYTGMRLFLNKLKEAMVVDDTVTTHILDVLPQELERHFPLNSLKNFKQKTSAKMVENIMLSEFTNYLQAPQVSTETFFKDLSTTISASVHTPAQEQDESAMRERLRGATFRLVDLLLSKTMWYPQNHESIWPSVLQIANNISLLCSASIINHLDDSCELYKTLISRFVHFIEESAGLLPIDWYNNIENDLHLGLIPFLETPELDEGVTSKKTLLLNALTQGKICAIAQQEHGIILQ